MTTEPFDVWITRYSELGTIWHASADQVEYDTDFPNSISVNDELLWPGEWHRSEESARQHAADLYPIKAEDFEIVEGP